MAEKKSITELKAEINEQKAMIRAMREIISALILKYGVREDTQFRKAR